MGVRFKKVIGIRKTEDGGKETKDRNTAEFFVCLRKKIWFEEEG